MVSNQDKIKIHISVVQIVKLIRAMQQDQRDYFFIEFYKELSKQGVKEGENDGNKGTV